MKYVRLIRADGTAFAALAPAVMTVSDHQGKATSRDKPKSEIMLFGGEKVYLRTTYEETLDLLEDRSELKRQRDL